MPAGGQSVYRAPGFWLDQSRAASGRAYAYVSITAAKTTVLRGLDLCVCDHSRGTIVLRGLDVCVCHHSHGNVQQRVAAVTLRGCAVRGSNQYDPSGLNKSDVDQESSFAARNAQFATSVERFLGFEHVGRHCLATPFLGL
jgi:hypothetical protein